jgi:hypothetical protein
MNLTISQVQTMVAELEASITQQLQQFKDATGLQVHSVPVVDESGGTTVVARVKVLIPETLPKGGK